MVGIAVVTMVCRAGKQGSVGFPLVGGRGAAYCVEGSQEDSNLD